MGRTGEERPEFLQRWGVWPATLVLLAFAWMELVWPRSGAPGTIAVAAIAYTGYLLVLVSLVGRETALSSGDAFTPYNRLFSSLVPWGRDAEGRVAWRGWLRALPAVPQWRGLPAFVVTMIGTVAYDGLSEGSWWGENMAARGDPLAIGTAGIVVSTALVDRIYIPIHADICNPAGFALQVAQQWALGKRADIGPGAGGQKHGGDHQQGR